MIYAHTHTHTRIVKCPGTECVLSKIEPCTVFLSFKKWCIWVLCFHVFHTLILHDLLCVYSNHSFAWNGIQHGHVVVEHCICMCILIQGEMQLGCIVMMFLLLVVFFVCLADF